MLDYEQVIKDYNKLLSITEELIENYGSTFWKVNFVDASDIEFDLEKRRIHFTWWHHGDSENVSIPLDCLLDRDNWVYIAQADIDEKTRIEKERRETAKRKQDEKRKKIKEQAWEQFVKDAKAKGYKLVKQ